MTISKKAALAILAAAAALTTAGSAQAGPPGIWTKVTGVVRPATNTDRISLARTPDGVLHVLSVPHTADGHNQPVQHRSLSANAKQLSAATDVFTYPDGANQSTSLVSGPGGLRAFFAGLDPFNPLDTGLATATSANGSAWSVQPTLASQASPPRSVYASAGIGGALLGSGSFLTTWGSAGSGAHLGIDPFTPDFDYSTGPCCDYDPGVGVDGATGAGIVAWKFIKSTSGMAARSLVPAGPEIPVPGAAAEVGQTTAITGRLGGKPGVYVAYGRGSNEFASRPAVWRFGASKSTTLASAAGARSVGISPAPEGRLWVFWASSKDHNVYARRSNRAATAWGPLRKVQAVKGTNTVWRVAGEGSAGPLDVFALSERSTSDFGFWQTRILPVLTVKATIAKQGKKVSATFRVTDVGDPVAGAVVTVPGAGARTTNAKGNATFVLTHGSYAAKATKGGYVPAKLKLSA